MKKCDFNVIIIGEFPSISNISAIIWKVSYEDFNREDHYEEIENKQPNLSKVNNQNNKDTLSHHRCIQIQTFHNTSVCPHLLDDENGESENGS